MIWVARYKMQITRLSMLGCVRRTHKLRDAAAPAWKERGVLKTTIKDCLEVINLLKEEREGKANSQLPLFKYTPQEK
jgi:hypothetical protein